MKNNFIVILFFLGLNLSAQIPCSSGFQGNGVEDFITIPNTDAINLQNTRDRTIEFWFKTSDITTRQVIYEEGAQVNTIFFFLEGGRIYLGAYRDNASVAADRRFFRSGAGDIEADQWYHVALTLEDTTSPDLTLKWFLNGEEQDSQDGLQVNTHSGNNSFARNGGELRYPSSLVSNWVASSVGGSTSETYSDTFTSAESTNYNYAGKIALFRIWNVARTQAEIDANKSTFLTSGTSLVAYLEEDQIIYQPDGGTAPTSSAIISGSERFTVIPNTDAINLQNTRDRTVELRFNASNVSTRQVLYEEGGATNAITAWIEDGRVYLGAYRNNADSAANRRFFRSAASSISSGVWYHIAITLEDTTSPDLTLKWYLDGIEQDSQDGLQVNTHSGDINIGRGDSAIRFPDDLVSNWTASSVGGSTSETYNSAASTDSNTNDYTGEIDLLRIWNVARTQSQIDTNQDVFLTSGTSLVAYQDGTQVNYQPDGGTSISAVVDESGVFTWDGSSSSVWTLNTNWTGDANPDATRRQVVTITNGTNDPVINTEISVGNLTVNSGVEIIIQDGGTLNVYYGLDNNGTITVEDGGALIYHNCNNPITGSGTFNVDKDSPSYAGTKFFSYWSSPVIEADSNIGTVFPSNPIIYLFDSSISNATWAFNGTTDFRPGIGYAVRSESAGSFSARFSGMINEGGIDVTTFFNTNLPSTDPGNVWSTQGDNLIGNPYPSAIDWDRIITDTDNSHLEGTVYFWSQNTAEVGTNNVSDYLQYNLTGGGTNTANGEIASMQGFFVRGTSAGTVNLKPTHQIAASVDQIFKNNRVEDPKKEGRSWFSLRQEKDYCSILVGFVDGATKSYDRLYDAPYDVNNQSLGLFSLVEGNKRASIQGRPVLKGKKKVVKLGFVVDTPGEYTIQLDEEHINEKYYIYLRDRQEKKTIDMRSRSYEFTVDSVGENLSRFRLIYTRKKRNNAMKSQELNDEELLTDDLITYVNRTDELIVELESIDDDIQSVQLFDIRGRNVANFSGSQTKSVSHLQTGIYIAVIGFESGKRVNKKIAIAR